MQLYSCLLITRQLKRMLATKRTGLTKFRGVRLIRQMTFDEIRVRVNFLRMNNCAGVKIFITEF